MQLPKSHTPHKVTKKTEFIKYVNESTSQQVNKSTRFFRGMSDESDWSDERTPY